MMKDSHGEAKILAGGQSLLPVMKLNLTDISYLVDLKRIPGLSTICIDRDQVSDNEEAVFVGALATHSEVAGSDIIRRSIPLLAETAAGIGHPLVRNRGTIAGSLSHSDPAGDLCVTALALDARMIIARYDGTRRIVRAQHFFTGVFANVLEEGELLEKVCFLIPPKGTGYRFEKLTLGHGDFPIIDVSVSLTIDSGRCADVAIAIGGVSDCPMRMSQCEDLLRGKENLSHEDMSRAGALAAGHRARRMTWRCPPRTRREWSGCW